MIRCIPCGHTQSLTSEINERKIPETRTMVNGLRYNNNRLIGKKFLFSKAYKLYEDEIVDSVL